MGHESRDLRARLPEGARIACVVSTYHHELTGAMCASAVETLRAAGLAEGHLLEVTVPGAFELPLVARRLAEREDVHAVLTFGLILKGETDHDVHIARAVSRALMDIGLACDKPVLFGVLTTNTLDQAQARARRAADGGLDKGHEVAKAAVETLAALRSAAGDPTGDPRPSREVSS